MRFAVAERMRGWDGVRWTLAAMLVAGFLLRLTLWLEWSPAFIGFPDSGGYLANSDPARTLFSAALRSPGYPIALMLLRALWDNLSWLTAVQHLLGLVSAVLYYAAAVRLGASRRWALLPAAVLALTGSLIFLEQAIMAEAVFIVLFGLALWLLARTVGAQRLWVVGLLSLLAGLALGWAAIGRTVAVPLIPLWAVWLAWAAGGEPVRRAAAAVPALAGAGAVVLTILLLAHSDFGSYGFARNDAYQVYGRVAPFVDCRVIDVPAGTRDLCPSIDARDRQGHDFWTFDPQGSPLVQ